MSETRTSLRVVIVDDEEPARLALRQDLGALEDVEIVAECANGFEAVKVVADLRPDLILLDVQMPKLDGFEVLELIGADVPVWDPQHSFGDTDLLVANMEQGRDLARVLGPRTSVLMRGHGSTVVGGSLREAVYAAVHLEINANLQLKAQAFGPVTFLTPGEIEKIRARQNRGRPGEGYDRAWQYWLRHAGFQSDE